MTTHKKREEAHVDEPALYPQLPRRHAITRLDIDVDRLARFARLLDLPRLIEGCVGNVDTESPLDLAHRV